MRHADFIEPPWEAPLLPDKVIAAIPAGATIAGMFFLALIEGSKRRNIALTFPSDRYLPFKFYPLRDFATTLVQGVQRFFPKQPLRQGLRALGANGPRAFAGSTLGKVTLGSAVDVTAGLVAVAKTYEINIPHSRCTVVESGAQSLVVSLENVYYFLDSHHVGVFEGVLEYMGVRGSVRIAARSDIAASFLIEWQP